MEIKELTEKEKELFIFLQNKRLEKDEEIITSYLNNNQIEANPNADFIKGAKNFFKGIKKDVMGYDGLKEKIDHEVSIFKTDHPSVLDEFEANKLMQEMYEYDTYGLSKIMLACSIILDNSYNYQYEDEGIKVCSKFLFNDEDKIGVLRKFLETNYRKIVLEPVTNIEKGFMITLGISSCALAIATPMAIIGLLKVGPIAALVSAFSASLFCLIGAESLRAYKHVETLKEFRECKPQEQGLYLALQLLVIKTIKDNVSKDEFKNKLDEILSIVSSIKSDLDFYTFVEQKDLINNKEKMEQFHRFDQILFKQLNLNQ